jgi:ubiquinone/menaquinone biosynthesis C-methylase UbiE
MSLAPVGAWDRPDTVAAFSRSAPNALLIDYARRRPVSATRVLDIGCGAGRNAVPLAADGFKVIGLDRSRAMLVAAAARSDGGRVQVIEAAMDQLPIRSRSIDLIVAHGIWNLARSDREWRDAVNEAARIAAPAARLFVFTFSRHTLDDSVAPVDGEQYVFT